MPPCHYEAYYNSSFDLKLVVFSLGWSTESPNYARIHDVMYSFYDCLCDQVRQETFCSSEAKGFDSWAEAKAKYDTSVDNISLNQWLNMWGRLCRGTAGISGFPFWVQLLGIIFFEVIDRDEDGLLEFEEIQNYYKGLVGVQRDELYVTTKEGFRALTAVRIHNFEIILLNQKMKIFSFLITEWCIRLDQRQLPVLLCQFPIGPGHLWAWKIYLRGV